MGILLQLNCFSFVVLLSIFDSILGITQPLSEILQAKNLNLSTAMEVLNSWKTITTMATDSEIAVASPTRRRSRLPSRFQECYVLETTGARGNRQR